MTHDVQTADAGVHTPPGGAPAVPAGPGVRRPLGLAEVALHGGLWGELQATNAAATLAHCERWMERLGWLDNFDRVAEGRTAEGERPGWNFSDSEAYKLLEALCWESGRAGGRADLEPVIARLTARIGRAQDADGYLNTCFGHPGQPARYTDLELGHELYCAGHLLQAAVARLRTHGDDELVAIGRRVADHVVAAFGPDGRDGLGGHPEIELGLVEFARATGERRYLDQAARFVDRRGHGTLRDIPLGRAYFQDDVPLRDAEVWRGHAVRALYLAAAAVDVAVDRGDDELFAALVRQWERTVARRTHVTGGMGSRHQDEGFGDDFELPPDRAYSETCAGIASVMVAWRLYLATGEARYVDLIERTLHNVVAVSPREDGCAFFYANPLQQRHVGPVSDDDAVSPRAEGGTRAAWFDVSCCPTNVARTLASLGGYVAAVGVDTVDLLLHVPSRTSTTLGDGRRVTFEVRTDYPRTGRIEVVVGDEVPADPWTLRVRVPAWAEGATLAAPGEPPLPVDPGFAALTRAFAPGDVVVLELPLAPRFTWPDPRIDALRGTVAVERGPDVLCLEGRDLPDLPFPELVVDPRATPLAAGDAAEVALEVRRTDVGAWAYASTPPAAEHVRSLTARLRPYREWARRGPTRMRVWLPTGEPPG
ncbi:glycoside hydrolase family 127 protein [Nitriliruptoraceae bacterium ZYF776]|nr:glycoside hydrolase family 127 protein [Profundirhabdus halotolerans]